jgi:hypothetical protein
MKSSKVAYPGRINKMAEKALVCKTINEIPLLLNVLIIKNSPLIKNYQRVIG